MEKFVAAFSPKSGSKQAKIWTIAFRVSDSGIKTVTSLGVSTGSLSFSSRMVIVSVVESLRGWEPLVSLGGITFSARTPSVYSD